jgi:hypothetical protein
MEKKTFKKIINDVLTLNGLSKNKNYYYIDNEDVIFVVGLQKSNFSNSYYINIGIIIKKLNPALENPRDVDGDIRARFSFQQKGKELDIFSLNDLSEADCDRLKEFIQNNINIYIKPITSLEKLKMLLIGQPVMLYQTTIRAKRVLGFES